VTVVPKKRTLEALREIVNIGKDFAGVDITKEPILIRPGQHYIMGGVKTDINGATAVSGLYAAGRGRLRLRPRRQPARRELPPGHAHLRPPRRRARRRPREGHGDADRLRRRQRSDEAEIDAIIARPKTGKRVSQIKDELGTVMNRHVAVFRDEAGLQVALETVKRLKEEAATAWIDDRGTVFNQDVLGAIELGYLLDTAEATVLSAIERKESRGAHTRMDFPTATTTSGSSTSTSPATAVTRPPCPTPP
jgi:succinate dehydrogenase / fumarate reductase flavoprotein subunit